MKVRLEASEREWRDRGYGMFAILDIETDRFLGRAGLKWWPQFGETEVGWALRPDSWGHGYASEAARACVEWGFGKLGLEYLTAMIRPDNVRSVKVAERLGMKPGRRELLLDVPVVVHSITHEAWGSSEAARAQRVSLKPSGLCKRDN